MNCALLSKTTGPELDSCDMQSANLLMTIDEVNYDTAPIAAVSPLDYPDDEEALHTSFEQAISGRVSIIQGRLSRLSAQHPAVVHAYDTDPMVRASDISQIKNVASHMTSTEPLPMEAASAHTPLISLRASLRQRYALFAALAVSFGMLGFDLMGLLVLNMR